VVAVRSLVRFDPTPIPAGQKTGAWEVWSTYSATYLGRVRWYAQWRRYAFWPDVDTLFDRACLDEISTFIAGQMAARAHPSAER